MSGGDTQVQEQIEMDTSYQKTLRLAQLIGLDYHCNDAKRTVWRQVKQPSAYSLTREAWPEWRPYECETDLQPIKRWVFTHHPKWPWPRPRLTELEHCRAFCDAVLQTFGEPTEPTQAEIDAEIEEEIEAEFEPDPEPSDLHLCKRIDSTRRFLEAWGGSDEEAGSAYALLGEAKTEIERLTAALRLACTPPFQPGGMPGECDEVRMLFCLRNAANAAERSEM